eukprot:3720460-Amphidinium_carterae.1
MALVFGHHQGVVGTPVACLSPTHRAHGPSNWNRRAPHHFRFGLVKIGFTSVVKPISCIRVSEVCNSLQIDFFVHVVLSRALVPDSTVSTTCSLIKEVFAGVIWHVIIIRPEPAALEIQRGAPTPKYKMHMLALAQQRCYP